MVCAWVGPSVFFPVVISSGQVRVVDLLLLSRPHEDASLAGLFGQPIVDVRQDCEGGTLWIAEAHIDPVIPETQGKPQTNPNPI